MCCVWGRTPYFMPIDAVRCHETLCNLLEINSTSLFLIMQMVTHSALFTSLPRHGKITRVQRVPTCSTSHEPSTNAYYVSFSAITLECSYLGEEHVRLASFPRLSRQLSSRARAMVGWKTSAMMIPSTIRSVMLFTYRPGSRRHVTPAPSMMKPSNRLIGEASA